MVAAFRRGLQEIGYIEGQNVAIEYRWADGRPDRLPALVAELVHHQVAVIAATSTPAALAAKAETTAIPIVFESGGDPLRLGLVASLSHPGGNVTGITQLNAVVSPKRLELLHELLPTARVMALLVNPASPTLAEIETNGALSAAQNLGMELHILNASSERDIEEAFAKLTHLGAKGLVISLLGIKPTWRIYEYMPEDLAHCITPGIEYRHERSDGCPAAVPGAIRAVR
jgi:putative ABC transport system substrate-binding protein